MKQIFIGSYIKQRRKDLGLSQEQLCDGICSPITMSRLETGSQTPSRSIINALLQRLGLPSDRYFALLNKHEAQEEALKREISFLRIQLSHAADRAEIIEKVNQKLCELERISDDNKLTRQMIQCVRISLERKNGNSYSPAHQLEQLLAALRLTVPQFDMHHLNANLYCLDEIKIINQIAGTFDDMGQYEQEIEIYRQLLDYIQSHYQDMLYDQAYLPMIAHNYARTLNLCGRNDEAVQVAEQGQHACIQCKNYQFLPRLLHVLAIAHHDLGHDKQSKDFYYQAYYLCKAIDDKNDLAHLCHDAREQYGIEFED